MADPLSSIHARTSTPDFLVGVDEGGTALIPLPNNGSDGIAFLSTKEKAALTNQFVTTLAAGVSFSMGTAKANATILNTAILAAYQRGGGRVFIPTPGNYYISAQDPTTADRIISIYSNVELDGVPGVNLIAPSGSDAPCVPLLVNANYRSNKVLVVSITCGVAGPPYVTTATVVCATAHGRAVGDFVQFKGDTTGYYIENTWMVVEIVNATTFKFLMFSFSSPPPAISGTVIMYPADANFTIGRNLTWDANLNSTNSGFLGDLGKMGAIFNKAGNYTVGGTFKNAAKYGVYYVNSFDATFSMGKPEGPSSAIQAGGPVARIKVEGYFAQNGDDLFPLVTDNAGFTFYDVRDSDNAVYANCTKSSDGNIHDVRFKGLQIQASGGRMLLLAANAGYSIKRVTVEGVQRSSSLAGGYALIDTAAGNTGYYEDIDIQGLYGNLPLNTSMLFIGVTAGATLNLKNVTVRAIGSHGGEVSGSTTGLTNDLVSLGTSTVNITGLTIHAPDVDADLTNAGNTVSLLAAGYGAGVNTLDDVTIISGNIRGTGSTRAIKAVRWGPKAAWSGLKLHGINVHGNASAFMEDTSQQGGVGDVQILQSKTDQGTAGSGQCGIISSGDRSMNATLIGNTAPSAVAGFFYVYGGSGKTFNLVLGGNECSNRLVRSNGNHTYNFRSMGGNKSNAFDKASGFMLQNELGSWTMNMFDNCLDIGTDVSGIARQSGTTVFNSNAALGTLGAAGPVVGQGTAANSWRLMGDPTLRY
jgi:hypothetical protein